MDALDELLWGLCFNRGGEPIPYERWRELYLYPEYQQLAYDKVNGSEISTVWLGLKTNLSGAPLIFETHVTGRVTGGTRYATEEQAVDGHNNWIFKALRAS